MRKQVFFLLILSLIFTHEVLAQSPSPVLGNGDGPLDIYREHNCRSDWLVYSVAHGGYRIERMRFLYPGTAVPLPPNCQIAPPSEISSLSRQLIVFDAQYPNYDAKRQAQIYERFETIKPLLSNAIKAAPRVEEVTASSGIQAVPKEEVLIERTEIEKVVAATVSAAVDWELNRWQDSVALKAVSGLTSFLNFISGILFTIVAAAILGPFVLKNVVVKGRYRKVRVIDKFLHFGLQGWIDGKKIWKCLKCGKGGLTTEELESHAVEHVELRLIIKPPAPNSPLIETN